LAGCCGYAHLSAHCTGPSGPSTATLLHQVTATTPTTGSMSATPSPCVAGANNLCTTHLSVSAAAGTKQIWVKMDNETEKLMGCDSSTGNRIRCAWIVAGHSYLFTLYAANDCTASGRVGSPIASTKVDGVTAVPATVPTVSITQTASTTVSGSEFTVQWSSTNATACDIQKLTPGDSAIAGIQAVAGIQAAQRAWCTAGLNKCGTSGSQFASPTVIGTHCTSSPVPARGIRDNDHSASGHAWNSAAATYPFRIANLRVCPARGYLFGTEPVRYTEKYCG